MAQDVEDTDDGDDEVNIWTFSGGRDYGRSLVCDDPEVRGGPDNDDVGGGSGDDNVYGGQNNDAVLGGLSGFFGDELYGEEGQDIVSDVTSGDYDLLHGGDGPTSSMRMMATA